MTDTDRIQACSEQDAVAADTQVLQQLEAFFERLVVDGLTPTAGQLVAGDAVFDAVNALFFGQALPGSLQIEPGEAVVFDKSQRLFNIECLLESGLHQIEHLCGDIFEFVDFNPLFFGFGELSANFSEIDLFEVMGNDDFPLVRSNGLEAFDLKLNDLLVRQGFHVRICM